jgi:predicted house-cleaning noncanonical NTP pyrophosphatase (MazG superfamily)
MDEKAVKSIAKAIAAAEAAKIVERRIAEFRNEVEEKLSRLGFDAASVRELVNELYNKLVNDVRQIIDQRIMHVLSVIDEQNSSIKDILDLVSALLELEIKSEEVLEKLRSELSEERIEESLYRVLVKRGIIRRKRRRWTLLIVGLGVLAAIVTGLLVNPIATLVILFIIFAILLRW